ncbi:MAG: pilus assembly protein PilM [Chloroflexi bacterium]|nr:pilus assembly protein PilM [Chloroflexota bacterium]
MPPRVVTVDIDSTTVRMLQLQGNRVERWASAPLDEGMVENGTILNPSLLGERIRQLRRTSDITGTEVVASVNGLFSVARTLNVPHVSQQELLQKLPEYAPETGGRQDLRLLWQTLHADTTSHHVLAMWANDGQVSSQLGALRAAGLAPTVLEFKTMALYRTVDRKQAIIVNMEPTSLDLVLVVGGLPQVMRTVGLPQASSPDELANLVAQAIEHTVAYHNARQTEELPPVRIPLFLVGPMADSPSVRQQVQERVEYPLESFAPDLEFPAHLPAGQYAVNLGLAMRYVARPREEGGEDRPPVHINLVPRVVSPWQITPQRAGMLAAMVAGLVVAFFLFQLNSGAAEEVATLRRSAGDVRRQISLRQAEITRMTQLEAGIRDFQALTAPRGRVTEAVEYIQSTLIRGVRLNSVSVKGNVAEFSASAERVEQAMAYVEALRATGRFGKVPYSTPSTEIHTTLDLGAPQSK